MAVSIGNDWDDILKGELDKQYFKQLQSSLDQEYRKHKDKINPSKDKIYQALKLTPFEKVKVVIVGQDPYYGEKQNIATGLAFSLPVWQKFSTEKKDVESSTKYIHELLKKDLNYAPVSHGCLESWARKGVLLLNAILTVRQGEARSHEGLGWKTFTDAIIRELSERKERMVFILWGEIAGEKRHRINGRHLILTAPHPNAGSFDVANKIKFLESKPFSEANKWLDRHGIAPVDWRL